MTNELLRRSATELAAMIRRREVSPVEVVDAHVDRITAVNPAINALVGERFEEARREAAAATDELMRRDRDALPPLFGVPCTIKEFLAVTGMPNTAGLLARKHVVATDDATVVRRVRDAGAIVLGVSNIPEGGMWMETANKIWGRTNNPWDLARTPGGSSGGEGALVASAGVPFGIGSDIAGSVRIPAAFCGVFGHKPTGRMVPNTGHWGPEGGTARAFMTTGPLARNARDLETVLDVIRGPDDVDPFIEPWTLPDRGPRDLRGVVVYPLESNGVTRVREVYRREIRRTAELLAARGAEVRELEVPTLRKTFAIWSRAMDEAGRGGPSFAELLGDGAPISLRGELARTLIGRSNVMIFSLGLALLEKLPRLLPARVAADIPSAEALQAELENALGDRGVLLHPPYSRPAPRHNAPLLTPFDFVCTGVFNIVGFPVTQVPTGFDDRGLPLGIQVAARRGNDRLTLAVARALEQDCGGWVPADP